MTYIKLDAVQKMMKSHKEKLCGIDNGVIQMILVDLLSIQTISPETMIEEMIEKEIDILNTISREGGDYLHHPYLKETLEELLQKFNS